MKSYLPTIDPEKETKVITSFIHKTVREQKMSNITIGISGGIDSTTSLYLLRKILQPENIFVAHLTYFPTHTNDLKHIFNVLKIPVQNQYFISIKKPVDDLCKLLPVSKRNKDYHVRIGNIMARIRMIILFDLAKKHDALVCGTENKSEHLLGYFTRFGDAASDIEPIQHLFKTQVYQIAKYLKVPDSIIQAKPTAGLWSGQTDEAEFGFSYEEADQVLYLYFEKKQSLQRIKKQGFLNVSNIINVAERNSFKHKVPYWLG